MTVKATSITITYAPDDYKEMQDKLALCDKVGDALEQIFNMTKGSRLGSTEYNIYKFLYETLYRKEA
jgi:hypothetical protein